ncbi:MAG TPA: prepilin-type N-terminal cleavage/methylation domain-containing protein [bacterium]|nr:prepilin-type N-terminal cleavage/methylation domain-containing protein [bacterium]
MYRQIRKRAFTLIELLIVVAIIGILAAIAVPNFMNARVRAKVSKAYSDIKAIAMANEMYALDNSGAYPNESEDHPYERGWAEAGVFWLTTPVAYMSSIPTDPFERLEDKTEHATPQVYETGTGKRGMKNVAYNIFTVGPNGVVDGITSSNPFTGPQKAGVNNTYSSSNGLKSGGDIYWYGGDCSVAKGLILDGKLYNGTCPPSFAN